ncbi:MAG: hypothetical protein JNK82_08525 [Myxococcaceae bacterium]|nr:hypothetical protein [Myxococcaceae bacterium]
MAAKFEQALKQNVLPARLGDVKLTCEPSMWVGRADRPARGPLSRVALVVGAAFGLATLAAIVLRADHETLAACVVPCVAGFGGAAWLEQRERRQRAFVVDFYEHVLRLDFSTPLGGMPRTLYVAFEKVHAVELEAQGDGLKVLTVDFDAGRGLYREVLAANIGPKQVEAAQRVRRMLRAAVGLEPPVEQGAQEPPPIVDSFG